jgi:hypothetical protein
MIVLVTVAFGFAGNAFSQGLPSGSGPSDTRNASMLLAGGQGSGTRIDRLRQELHVAETRQEDSADDAQYFFEAVTIIIAVATLLIAVVAIVATILGYHLVRRYIEVEFTKRASDAYEEHGRPLLDEGIGDMQRNINEKFEEIDETLANELEMFRKATST